MTRLYYEDSYRTQFDAQVVDAGADRVYLDCTAFYPTSGGQPFDTGMLGGARVLDVVDEGERIAHVVDRPVVGAVMGMVDWPRRFDHMQQHTGQHLLSAVLHEDFGLTTVSFHLGAETSTIDLAAPAIDASTILEAERRANQRIWENRAVTVSYREAGDPELGLRKASDREGTLRIVTIEGLDQSACGGTHVRATGEIGSIGIRKLDKMRGNLRLEFVCGGRAISAARQDYDTLAAIARTLSAASEDAAALVEQQAARLAVAEKDLRKAQIQIAEQRGRALYSADRPLYLNRIAAGPLDDLIRAEAQAYCASGPGLYIAASASPPSILLAASDGRNAGAILKAALAQRGGRGGGGATLAQGSLPTVEALDAVVADLSA